MSGGGVLLFSLSMSLTSCEGALDDILGEWSRPTPGSSTGGAVAVTSIDLDADEMKLAVGDQGQLNITDVAPADATDKTVSWSSNQEAIATVDKNGLVTAVAAGTAVITATANDGSGVKATCTVTVKIPGLLAGKFSVSATKKVQFSQGNLQATTNDLGVTWTWAFAENQWDYIGGTMSASDASATTNNKINGNGTVSVNGTVDLFGWVGASNTTWTGAAIYGISNSINPADYGTNATEALRSDWGKLAISNGGNAENSGWRTLTGGSGGEWEWILGPKDAPNPGTNCRTSTTIGGTANARFVKATVHSTKGVIIFPDEITWNTTTMGTAPTTSNTANDDFTYSPSDDNWTALEAAGCVFLPAAGYRSGTEVYVGSSSYWSSSPSSSDAGRAYGVYFQSTDLSPVDNYNNRYFGVSVRLVRPAE